ncbi:cytochrome P450 [Streptomyces paludis]|nr:cytochrome P450 [Streptomyces paludis]
MATSPDALADALTLPGPVGADRRGWRRAYDADPAGFLSASQERWGDTFTLDKNLVVVGDPDMAHQILVATDRESVIGPDRLEGRFPTAEETREWMGTRKLIGRVLTPQAVRGQLPRLEQAVSTGLESLAGGGPFDPMAVTHETCLRAFLPMYLPGPAPAVVSALRDSIRAALVLADAGVHLPRWWPSSMRRRVLTARRRVHAELRALITAQRPDDQVPSDSPTLSDLLRTASVPTDQAVHVLGNALSKGLPATAGAWSWLLHDLAARPDDMARIRDEAIACRASGEELSYTRAFVRESMRTHPPAWLLARETTAPTAVSERCTVPAGTTLFVSPYLIHRDPRYWPDPHRFTPDRWTSPHTERHRYAYLPFGAGPRVCVGLHLGEVLLTLTAARIATDHHLTVTTPATAPAFRSVLQPTGIRLQLTRRAPGA